MGECNHECDSCDAKRDGACGGLKAASNALSSVRRTIAVMSGKGGVGKSMVAGMLAVAATRRGLKAGILDADITGPSIPTAFGIAGRVDSDGENILPCRSAGGVDVVSLNLVAEDPAGPVIWRGPVLAGVVRQFWTDVAWGDKDLLVVDMPPGTGDVPLTVFQSLPVDGVVVVTSPQDLVSLIVEKALRMADMMKIPVLGLVENLSEFRCPGCGRTHRIFGDRSQAATLARLHGIGATVSLPIDPALAAAVDAGRIESVDSAAFDPLVDAILRAGEERQA